MANNEIEQAIATILEEPGQGDKVDRLVPLLYEELKTLARRQMAGERPGHTLNPTALANEAYLRLSGSRDVSAHGKHYLMGAAAQAMRRILVDHARRRHRHKRGGDRQRVTLDAHNEPAVLVDELIELDEALEKLAKLAPRQAKVVEARYFGGMTVKETADLLSVSERTVKSNWVFARTWLNRSLNG